MNSYINKVQENKKASNVNQKKNNDSIATKFSDQTSTTVSQTQLQKIADNSSQVQQAAQLQAKINTYAALPIQKKEIEEEELQMKATPVQRQNIEEEEPRQMKASPIQRQSIEEEPLQGRFTLPIQKKENKTGLPDNLKSGIENLSGYAMDDVKVHYNSDKPAQLQAHAYAQGTDIHIAPGQEKHLPHEAWHVVQQAQGRVRPTVQMKGDVPVNDDVGLEAEADLMGVRALSMTLDIPSASLASASTTQKVAQLVGGNKAGYNPDTIVQPGFKLAVKILFATARDLNKIRKKIAGKKNNTKLGSIAENKKGSQVKNVYALELANINLDAQWLHKMVTDKPHVDNLLKTAKDEAIIAEGEISPITEKVKESDEKVEINPAEEKILDKSWVEKVGETRPEAKILTGSALFIKKTEIKDAGPGIYRDIYKKLGKEDGDHNEYVLDDLGTHTRRFAYMEKSYYQWMAYMEKKFLTGKKQDLVGAATGVSALDVDPTDFEAQGMMIDEKNIFNKIVKPNKTKKNLRIALAHMHQWKGSGPGQRGLSLTSTDKDEAVYGNSGEPFKTDDGAKFKIDLAKTNPANNILVNHYANDSKTRANLPGSEEDLNGKLGVGKKKYQYERSVIKNRELYLRNLTPDAVISITPHTAGMVVDRDSAIYNKSRQDAIDHGKEQRGVDEWTAYKKVKKAELDKATQDEASAEVEKATALEQKRNAAIQKNNYKGNFNKYWLEGFDNKISYYKAWESYETCYANQATTQTKNIQKLQKIIQDLDPILVKCDEQIRIFTSRLKVKPDEANLHASRGWATGEAYTKGYSEGLVAIKGKSFTKDTAIKKIFDEAYKDASYKAENKNYKEKHSPYWEGYGAALKTAIKP
ncbi:DUF4157 domain-containing protein [Flavobacterium pectinovorum]|uniref:eCIS core domain-containing protein n=1 Tax=Flavobacterium pectinovorum TaxID=29533 RepID=UPI00265F9E78|nr:DUF4157 domain-containing protein [Flavobacterium pectinovorum]WKL50481.1 DUF4157 domain-containing protein [Flavobacterium pectinovorum]